MTLGPALNPGLFMSRVGRDDLCIQTRSQSQLVDLGVR